MKNIVIIITLLVFVVGGYFLFTNNSLPEENSSTAYTSDVYTFTSPNGQFTVQYNDDGDAALLTYDNTQYKLKSVVSASGAKYESEDSSVLFWEHQGEALFEIDGKPVFTEPAKLTCNETNQDCTGSDGQMAEPDHLDDGTELTSHSWLWRETDNSDGSIEAKPQKASAFVLTFMNDNRFSATTDCNNVMGNYMLSGEKLTFSQIATTKMACPQETQETQFTSMLKEVTKITLTNEGQASLKLHTPNGVMQFVAVPDGVTLNHDEIIGMSEKEAAAYAKDKKVPFRVTKRDDEYLPATLDYRPGRINAEVEDGVVTGYEVEI